ncbi:glycosyltransferase family 9 protein [Sediminicoccus sp. KRV36]|uniref:glycosyltransferase family 9 protein n=1 Tax=Sediminicoccus sp. KRV36 TaxID=3133721 RepID=UPI002010100C|nr:glycosyltransferase family 9 protein [Sediminicoccus rosea]UPY37852.1 glycosyltransferase family 9 protein [Sediminicoccus rosea]
MRILFITSTRIGDAVLSTGLLDHLLREQPEARITIVCGTVAEGVFARMPGLARIIPVTKRRWSLHWLALWWQVAFTRWDLVVDLRGSAIAWLLLARRRAVMKGGRRSGHRSLHIAEVLGVTPAPRPVAWFGAAEASQAEALLPGGPWLILAPTANWRVKMWPAERFIALAQKLTGSAGLLPGARIAILGGPGETERAMAAPVLAALPDAVDLVGRLSLPEVAAVLARGGLFVGNDSGLMHLSAATGAPTLGLFGPTPASEYAPIGDRAMAVLARGPAAQSPMQRLAVEAVIEAAQRVLARVPA